ncbi:mannitol dehydrogenase family protein [Pseudaestuariivita sp.]|uniref:mannitol dehydrogenase family protein n=1 Tax=Pseudaestuariivita sp. TaxID=2211669 RepID=UPI004059AED3
MTGAILHLGLGAFFRAHVADYTEDAGGWRIEPVAMRSRALIDARTRDAFGLVIRAPDGPRLKPITCVGAAHHLPTQAEQIVRRIADPDVQIVTLTVTEKGYGALLPEARLDLGNPGITGDLQGTAPPTTAIGVLARGLETRMGQGGTGLTLMSCDNLTGNGALLRALLLEFAAETDPTLRDWIAAHCTFPSSMVDRITPASTSDTFATAEALRGAPDPWAVETEPFRQWVIEDSFAGPRPAWEKTGAQIVPDVAPFEEMKLRMLNGAHSLLAYLGALAGLEAVRDVMQHPIVALIEAHMTAAARTLPSGLDTEGYRADLLKRFANPAIQHLCRQIAMDGSQKLPQRILRPALAALHAGHSLDSYALPLAAWLRFAAGEGAALQDPQARVIVTFPAAMPDRLYATQTLFGVEFEPLFAHHEFTDAVQRADTMLQGTPANSWAQTWLQL